MLPELFLERMKNLLGEEYNAFLASLEEEKYQALRVNPLKKHENSMENIRSAFALSPVSWAVNGYYYDKAAHPGKHPYHEAGVYYIQEPSAMAPVTLLDVQPG